MNERIRKLAHEAGIKITPMIVDGIEYEYEDVDMDGSEDLAKFAELIVEKCAAIIESQDVDPSFKLRMSWAVKQYFRVEE